MDDVPPPTCCLLRHRPLAALVAHEARSGLLARFARIRGAFDVAFLDIEVVDEVRVERDPLQVLHRRVAILVDDRRDLRDLELPAREMELAVAKACGRSRRRDGALAATTAAGLEAVA